MTEKYCDRCGAILKETDDGFPVKCIIAGERYDLCTECGWFFHDIVNNFMHTEGRPAELIAEQIGKGDHYTEWLVTKICQFLDGYAKGDSLVELYNAVRYFRELNARLRREENHD